MATREDNDRQDDDIGDAAIDGDDVIDSVGEKTADVEHDAWLEMRRFLSIGDDGRMRGGRGENWKNQNGITIIIITCHFQ